MPSEKQSSNQQQNCYFLTFNVVDWVDVFIRPAYKNVIVNSLNYFVEKKGLVIHAWCLMSNHLHLLAKIPESYPLSHLLREFKRLSCKEIFSLMNNETEPDCRRNWMMERFQSPVTVTRHVGKYQLWQEGNHPALLKDSDPVGIFQQIELIHNNPVRCLIVENPESYLFSSASDYKGKKGPVKVKTFSLLSKK